MKPVHSIRSFAILAGAMLLPLGVPAFGPQGAAVVPLFPSEAPAAVASAPEARSQVEQNAVRLVDAIIQIESKGDARMVGLHGERGLMQIKSGTWHDMTIRLFGKPLPFDQAFDPAMNRRIGTAYLAWLQGILLPRQSEWKEDERALLLAAYNAGPGRLVESGFDLDLMPQQTRDYVERASALHDFYLDGLASSGRLHLLAPAKS